MGQDDHGRLIEPQLASGHDAPVPRDYHTIIANEDGVHEPKLCNRASDLCDLRVRMGASIARLCCTEVARRASARLRRLLHDADEMGLPKFAHAIEGFNGNFYLRHTTGVVA